MGAPTSSPFRYAVRSSHDDATVDLEALAFDGGLIWLREADTELGLFETREDQTPEWRNGMSL